MKKGFTLVEIIISISLILIVGTSTTFFVLSKNNNNKIEKITKEILEATKLFLEIETDENGNTYKIGLLNGGTAVAIHLSDLEKKGYINGDVIKTLEDKKIKKEEYILAAIFSDASDQCSNSENIIKFEASWLDKLKKNAEEPIYLCEYENSGNGGVISLEKDLNDDGAVTLFEDFYYDYKGNTKNISEANTYNHLYMEDLNNGQIPNAKASVWLPTYRSGLYKSGNDYNHDYLYLLGNEISDNYVSINGVLFRILSLNFGFDTMVLITEKAIDSWYYDDANDPEYNDKANNRSDTLDQMALKVIDFWFDNNFNSEDQNFKNLFIEQNVCFKNESNQEESDYNCNETIKQKARLLSTNEADILGLDFVPNDFSNLCLPFFYYYSSCHGGFIYKDIWIGSGDSSLIMYKNNSYYRIMLNNMYDTLETDYIAAGVHGVYKDFPSTLGDRESDYVLTSALRPVVEIQASMSNYSGKGTKQNPYVIKEI